MPNLANQIDALLPQTQCQRCGYTGCAPYAQAIQAGETDINRCPPGGEQTIAKLAHLTGKPAKPLAPECGNADERKVAFIREDECIGCTKCIQVCPVDAILGAAKQMHTVLANECTGCELCVPACPVDCIDLPTAAVDEGQPQWPPYSELDAQRADLARTRTQSRNTRLAQEHADKRARREAKKAAAENEVETQRQTRKQDIAAAIARAKAKRKNQN